MKYLLLMFIITGCYGTVIESVPVPPEFKVGQCVAGDNYPGMVMCVDVKGREYFIASYSRFSSLEKWVLFHGSTLTNTFDKVSERLIKIKCPDPLHINIELEDRIKTMAQHPRWDCGNLSDRE